MKIRLMKIMMITMLTMVILVTKTLEDDDFVNGVVNDGDKYVINYNDVDEGHNENEEKDEIHDFKIKFLNGIDMGKLKFTDKIHRYTDRCTQ